MHPGSRKECRLFYLCQLNRDRVAIGPEMFVFDWNSVAAAVTAVFAFIICVDESTFVNHRPVIDIIAFVKSSYTCIYALACA